MGGGKWKKDAEAVAQHARGLGILDVPTDPLSLKGGEWQSFVDRLKARTEEATAGGTQDFVLGATEEQKRRSSDWYRTPAGAAYAASLGKPTSFGVNENFPVKGADTTTTKGLLESAWGQNPNFPMLQSDYTIPSYSAETNPWTDATIGSSYMPWTTEGMANVPTDARSYLAPELTLEHPRYIDNPLGLLELPEDWEDLLDMGEDDDEDDDDEDDEESEAGGESTLYD